MDDSDDSDEVRRSPSIASSFGSNRSGISHPPRTSKRTGITVGTSYCDLEARRGCADLDEIGSWLDNNQYFKWHRGRNRSGTQTEFLFPVDSVSSLSSSSISRPNSCEYSEEHLVAPGPQMRILSPRAPILNHHRTTGILGAPTGSIDLSQHPVLAENTAEQFYTVLPESKSATVPLTASPNGTQRCYYPTVPTTPPPLPLPGQQQQLSGSVAPSRGASPSTTYSSIAQANRSLVAPIQIPGQTPANMHIGLAHSAGAVSVLHPGSTHAIDDKLMVGTSWLASSALSISSSVCQAITRQDHIATVNARASVTYRARRKEKERESSKSISKLEQQIVDANEEVDFYRRERDCLAELLYNTPGGSSHFPRPPSPRRYRARSRRLKRKYLSRTPYINPGGQIHSLRQSSPRRHPHPATCSRHNTPSLTSGSSSSNLGALAALTGTVGSPDHPDDPERLEFGRNVRPKISSYPPANVNTLLNQPLAAISPPHGALLSNAIALGQGPQASSSREDLSERVRYGLRAQPSPQRPGAHNPFLEKFDRD